MPAVAPDLADLLARVADRDHAAFESLYGRSSAKLYGVILRIVRSRELADELLQDVFLRVWQNAKTFTPESGRPMTWMIAIARYAAIDLVRKRVNDGALLVADLPELSDDPERRTVIQDQLGHCLGRLAPPQLECVVLAYCNGYSREELSRHFSAQVPTIKTWLRRSLDVLRLCLAGAT